MKPESAIVTFTGKNAKQISVKVERLDGGKMNIHQANMYPKHETEHAGELHADLFATLWQALKIGITETK